MPSKYDLELEAALAVGVVDTENDFENAFGIHCLMCETGDKELIDASEKNLDEYGEIMMNVSDNYDRFINKESTLAIKLEAAAVAFNLAVDIWHKLWKIKAPNGCTELHKVALLRATNRYNNLNSKYKELTNRDDWKDNGL